MEIREGRPAFKEIFSRCFFSEKRGKSGCYFFLLSSFRCETPSLSASAAKFSTAGKDLAVFRDARARFCDRSPENNSCRMTSTDTFLEVTLHLVSQFVGGRGIDAGIVQFGIGAAMRGVLWAIAGEIRKKGWPAATGFCRQGE